MNRLAKVNRNFGYVIRGPGGWLLMRAGAEEFGETEPVRFVSLSEAVQTVRRLKREGCGYRLAVVDEFNGQEVYVK